MIMWIKKVMQNKLTEQSGAIFGLDARVALAIFSVLSVVGGASAVLSTQSIRAKGLAKEMDSFGKAVETLHQDLKEDVFAALITPSDQSAFTALFDKTVLEESRMQGRWLGPYISSVDTKHPHFGERIITKQGEDFTKTCEIGEPCYLWLVYAAVPKRAAEEVNDLIDGPREALGDSNGRFQWTTSTRRSGFEVGYRVSTAMNTGNLLY